MRIVFVGPPGAGKGTQSKRLLEYLGVTHLSTGDMLRKEIAERSEIGRASEQYMTSGELVPDPLILAIMAQRLDQPDCAQGYLLDGFPRTLVQAQSLDESLAGRGTPLDCVLELVVDKEELLRRMADRRRADDRPEIIRQRLEQYYRQTEPLVDYYRQRGLLHTIDALGTADEVFERIKLVLDQVSARAHETC